MFPTELTSREKKTKKNGIRLQVTAERRVREAKQRARNLILVSSERLK